MVLVFGHGEIKLNFHQGCCALLLVHSLLTYPGTLTSELLTAGE
jgi:hypothetical protein